MIAFKITFTTLPFFEEFGSLKNFESTPVQEEFLSVWSKRFIPRAIFAEISAYEVTGLTH